MAESVKTLPYELLAEQLASEAFDRLGDMIQSRSPHVRAVMQEILHDVLEIGMELSPNEGTPGDVMSAYNAGYAHGQQETLTDET